MLKKLLVVAALVATVGVIGTASDANANNRHQIEKVTICHFSKHSQAWSQQNVIKLEALAHSLVDKSDIIPPFSYKNIIGQTKYFAGLNWTEENEAFLRHGCKNIVVETPKPTQTDPCGLNNAEWVKPDDSDEITWTLTDGVLVATANHGYIFADDQKTNRFWRSS